MGMNMQDWILILVAALMLISVCCVVAYMAYDIGKKRKMRSNESARIACAGQFERVITVYKCDPLLTNVQKMTAVQLYTGQKIISDECVPLPDEHSEHDIIKTNSGLLRVDIVEEVIACGADGDYEYFFRLLTSKVQ